MQKRREEIAKAYNDAFGNTEGIIIPTSRPYVRHAWHLYAIQVNTNVLRANRDTVIDALKARNIGTSVHFIPLHLHPYYRSQYGYKRGDFPNAEHFFDREISLPLYPRMTDDDVEDVITAVKHVTNEYK
jgi:dTDP-4-amino-4,6-dideoxygalactose transaminase